MTLLLIFLTCAFTLYAVAKMVAPFLEERDDQIRAELLDEELREIEQLVARKSALLLALRDIEYDWETSKVSEEDYTRFKRSCERQAVAVMRRLDAIHGGRGWEEVIDEELRRRVGAVASDDEEASAEVIPAEEATADPPSQPTLGCTACGAALEEDDRFCGKGGTPVASPPMTASKEPDNHAVEATP
jgi:hypothetical protein